LNGGRNTNPEEPRILRPSENSHNYIPKRKMKLTTDSTCLITSVFAFSFE
jgi:hypothetical protein